MSLTALASIGVDLAALAILIGALYLPRHGRKDLLAAYIGINVGVLAVTLLLATATISAGLGLGLFGVLSIIRLRSTEISQHEIAYFFAALALGLLGGIGAPLAVTGVLMALVVASLWIGDHPALMRRNRHQVVMLDRAIADEPSLVTHLERLLGGTVRSVEVQRLDLVNDTTLVDVRYRLHPSPARERRPEESAVASSSVPVPSTSAASAAPSASLLDDWYSAPPAPAHYQPQRAATR